MRSSSERKTSPSSSATFHPRSSPAEAIDRWAGTRWGGPGTALAAILAGAATLRLVGIQYGLPFGNLLNPDEQSIVPRAWKLELAGVAIGLAMGFKYPGVFLFVPLVVAGWKHWRRLAMSGILAVAAFLASSPFIVVHAHQARHEAFRVQRLARDGWLGFEHDHIAPVAFVGRLWDGLGPALIVCGVGLVIALVRRTRTDLILASFVVVYFADLLTLSAHFDRYVLPLVPALGALAGRMRSLAPVTLLLLVVPLTWSIRDAKVLTRTDTRIVAHRWVVRHLAAGSRIAADPSTARFERLCVTPLLLCGPT